MVSLNSGAAACGPQPPLCLLPAASPRSGSSPAIGRALFIVAGGGRALDWSPLRIASALQA